MRGDCGYVCPAVGSLIRLGTHDVWELKGTLKAWVKLRGGSRIVCRTADSHVGQVISG